jgi:hypothetical protein
MLHSGLLTGFWAFSYKQIPTFCLCLLAFLCPFWLDSSLSEERLPPQRLPHLLQNNCA